MSAYTFLGHELRPGMAERWPSGIPVWEQGGTYVYRENTAAQVPVPRCVCGHAEQMHGYSRRGKPVCNGSVVCGCGDYVPTGEKK